MLQWRNGWNASDLKSDTHEVNTVGSSPTWSTNFDSAAWIVTRNKIKSSYEGLQLDGRQDAGSL